MDAGIGRQEEGGLCVGTVWRPGDGVGARGKVRGARRKCGMEKEAGTERGGGGFRHGCGEGTR